jgi:FkbM family methyltransferase
LNKRDTVARYVERIARLLAPLRAQLPIAHYFYSRSGLGEPELGLLANLVEATKEAVDIGANIGLYTYRLSKLCSHVFAFEPNPVLFRVLEGARLANVSPRCIALSGRTGTADFFVPEAAYGELLGWGSLVPGRCPEACAERTLSVQTATLDSFELTRVSFVKMDVEGHELAVLSGSEATIAANRPVLLLEVDEPHRQDVDSLLRRHRYRRRELEELFGVRGSPANLLYLPV